MLQREVQSEDEDENNILTWQKLQQRGWMGPGMCHFCKNVSEENAHLFIHCSFTKSIWDKIRSIKNIRDNWDGVDLDVCLTRWMKNKNNSSSFAAHICWNIWLERNAVIFEGKKPSIQSVVIKALGATKIPEVNMNTTSNQRVRLDVPLEFSLACFDGAAQINGTCSGAGGIIKLSSTKVYKLYYNCSKGTNTKTELLGACDLSWRLETKGC